MIRLSTFFISIILLLTACTSGKKALQQGDYDEAVYKAVKRLRSNSSHRKSLETLKITYPLAQNWHLNRIKSLEMSYDIFKWEPIAKEYELLIHLSNEIMTCPGCLNAIPAPSNYSLEFEQAKLKAASDRYEAGIKSLSKGKTGDRNEAKNAYAHFDLADRWIRGYKDVDEKLKEAERYASINVVVEPIPMHSRTFQLSNEFFDNKINEFLLRSPVNRFVKFYTVKEAKRLGINKPDQIIQLIFDDFVVGQTYMHEKEMDLSKEVVLATYEVDVPKGETPGNGDDKAKVTICHKAPGSSRTETITVAEDALKAHLDHGDKIGSCSGENKINASQNAGTGSKKETRKIYGQAKATMHVFTRTVESKGLLDLKILDGYTRRVISQEKLPGAFVWQAQWGYYNGDQRALEKQHHEIVKSKEVPPPAPQDLFIAFTEPIYKQVIAKLNNFYRNY